MEGIVDVCAHPKICGLEPFHLSIFRRACCVACIARALCFFFVFVFFILFYNNNTDEPKKKKKKKKKKIHKPAAASLLLLLLLNTTTSMPLPPRVADGLCHFRAAGPPALGLTTKIKFPQRQRREG